MQVNLIAMIYQTSTTLTQFHTINIKPITKLTNSSRTPIIEVTRPHFCSPSNASHIPSQYTLTQSPGGSFQSLISVSLLIPTTLHSSFRWLEFIRLLMLADMLVLSACGLGLFVLAPVRRIWIFGILKLRAS